MASKVYLSEWTWRSFEYQRAIIYSKFPELLHSPEYRGVEDKSFMFRPTIRKIKSTIYVSSIATLANSAGDLYVACQSLKARGFSLFSVEENKLWKLPINWTNFLDAWKEARKHGAAKIGGKMSADIKKAKSAEAIAKIKDRWPLPSKEWPTKVLLKEADVSLNTVKSLLGKRPIAQYNYQAKVKRQKKRYEDSGLFKPGPLIEIMKKANRNAKR